MHHTFMKTSTVLLMLTLSLQAESKNTELSTAAQQGPLTLKENFKLAKSYPTPSGWLLANACSGCHGTNGSEMDNDIPPIVGMDKTTFISTIKAYQTEKPSKSTVMTLVTEPLTDKEIEAMAAYFSKQKVEEWTQPDWQKDVKTPAWVKTFNKGVSDAK